MDIKNNPTGNKGFAVEDFGNVSRQTKEEYLVWEEKANAPTTIEVAGLFDKKPAIPDGVSTIGLRG